MQSYLLCSGPEHWSSPWRYLHQLVCIWSAGNPGVHHLRVHDELEAVGSPVDRLPRSRWLWHLMLSLYPNDIVWLASMFTVLYIDCY